MGNIPETNPRTHLLFDNSSHNLCSMDGKRTHPCWHPPCTKMDPTEGTSSVLPRKYPCRREDTSPPLRGIGPGCTPRIPPDTPPQPDGRHPRAISPTFPSTTPCDLRRRTPPPWRSGGRCEDTHNFPARRLRTPFDLAAGRADLGIPPGDGASAAVGTVDAEVR